MKLGSIKLPSGGRSSRAPIPRSRKIALIAVASLGLLVWAKPMGLLLWARIRILTNIPKTAIADPMVTQSTKPSQPPELDPQLPGDAAALRDPFSVDAAVFPPVAPRQTTQPGNARSGTPADATTNGTKNGTANGTAPGTTTTGPAPDGESAAPEIGRAHV